MNTFSVSSAVLPRCYRHCLERISPENTVIFNIMMCFLAFLWKGDWHQYDDIICTEPSRTEKITGKIKKIFVPEQRQNLIKGRQIAGTVMLETIFELLRSWSDVNLRSFWMRLNQFFEVYADPYVFEEKQKKWTSLDYGIEDVSSVKQAGFLGHVDR